MQTPSKLVLYATLAGVSAEVLASPWGESCSPVRSAMQCPAHEHVPERPHGRLPSQLSTVILSTSAST